MPAQCDRAAISYLQGCTAANFQPSPPPALSPPRRSAGAHGRGASSALGGSESASSISSNPLLTTKRAEPIFMLPRLAADRPRRASESRKEKSVVGCYILPVKAPKLISP